MKSILAIGAALCSIASAWPLLSRAQQAPPAAGTLLYQLQAKSAMSSINNQYVTLLSSGSYGLGAQSAASKFFVNKYDPTGTYAFHNADDTRQVALRGSSSALLYLVDVTNPRSDTIPGGQLMEWSTFTMDSNVLGVKDGSTLTGRTFVGVGSGSALTLALYDGVSNTTVTQVPLTLNIVRSGSATASLVRRALGLIYG